MLNGTHRAWLSRRGQGGRAFVCSLLSFCLFAQGCIKQGRLTKDSKNSRKEGSRAADKIIDVGKARGGIAITRPRRGFVNQPIVLVEGTAPAGSKMTIFDGPQTVGEGIAKSDGTFSVAVSSLGEGFHLLRADSVGVGSSSVVKVTVDAVAPTVSFVETPPAMVSEPYAKFRWQGSEDPVLSSYKLDDQAASPFALADRIGVNAISPGSHTFTVVAKDLAGNQGQPASLTFTYQPPSHEKLTNLVIAPNPFTPNGDGVEDTTTISASMADGQSHAWKIEIKNSNGAAVQTFAGSGTTLSATWDGNNGNGVPQAVGGYVTDIAVGGITRSFTIHLSGWKTGYLNDSKVELKLPASGLPVEINRRYRSDRVNESGSFGRGGFSDVLDTAITVDNGKLPVTFKTPAESRITFPFKREFAGATGTFKSTWAAPEGHLFKDRFAPAYVIDLRNDPKNPEYVDLDLNDYKPAAFDWKHRDGNEMDFSVGKGMERHKDPNGNQLTFTPDAIVHSNGRAVNLIRDEQGRITQIKDPNGHVAKYAYDGQGRLVSVADPLGNSSSFSYDEGHRIVEQKTGMGDTFRRYGYDASGVLLAAWNSQNRILAFQQGASQDRIVNPGGMPIQRTFNGDGTLAALASPMGEQVKYAYNDRKQVTQVEAPDGSSEKLNYSAQGDLMERTHPDGTVSSFTYDAVGRMLAQASHGGQWSYAYDTRGNLFQKTFTPKEGTAETFNYAYDAKGNVLAETNPKGQKTSYEYDSAGNRIKTVFPDSSVETSAYDANGNLVSRKLETVGGQTATLETYVYDALNRMTEVASSKVTAKLTYDPYGNIAKAAAHFANGTTRTETMAYTPEGDLLSWTESSGTTHAYGYDPAGHVLVEQVNERAVLYHQYDENGRRIRTVSPDGTWTAWEYDKLGRVAASRSSENGITRWTYDAVGRITSVTTEGIRKSMAYNADGRVIAITATNEAGGVWVSTYDPLTGRLISAVDPSGATTLFTYDASGNLIKVGQKLTNGSLRETLYTYDKEGHLLAQTDAKGRVTSWTYDSAGRVASRTLPEGQTESFFYDEKGRLAKHQKLDGSPIAYVYTAEGKPYKKIYPDGMEVGWTYARNEKGEEQLVEIRSHAGSVKRIHDSASKLAAVIDPNNRMLKYDYDPSGRVTRMNFEVGDIRYGFDDRERLVWIQGPDRKITRYFYEDAPGSRNRTRIEHGNGTLEELAYDAAGRVIRVTHRDALGKLLGDFQYTRNGSGQVTKEVQETGRTVEYGYDEPGMLVEEKITGSDGAVVRITYAYDEVGNRLRKNVTAAMGTVTTEYTYNRNDWLLSETKNGMVTEYRSDANGNTLAGGAAEYRYDFDDRLVWARVPKGGMSLDLAFGYDPEGARIAKTAMGQKTDFLVDKNRTHSQVVAEIQNEQVRAAYVAADRGPTGNEVVSAHVGLARYDYHEDGSNRSVRMLTDLWQNVAQRYDFDAFGNERGSSGGMAWPNPYRFAGEWFDEDLGMSDHRARYYDPRIGRFLTMDTFEGYRDDTLSLHKYLYAGNDPVNKVDPSGHSFLAQFLAVPSLMQVLHTAAWSAVQTVALYFAHAAAAHLYGLAVERNWGSMWEGLLGGVTGGLDTVLDPFQHGILQGFGIITLVALGTIGLGQALRHLASWLSGALSRGIGRLFGNAAGSASGRGLARILSGAMRSLRGDVALNLPNSFGKMEELVFLGVDPKKNPEVREALSKLAKWYAEKFGTSDFERFMVDISEHGSFWFEGLMARFSGIEEPLAKLELEIVRKIWLRDPWRFRMILSSKLEQKINEYQLISPDFNPFREIIQPLVSGEGIQMNGRTLFVNLEKIDPDKFLVEALDVIQDVCERMGADDLAAKLGHISTRTQTEVVGRQVRIQLGLPKIEPTNLHAPDLEVISRTVEDAAARRLMMPGSDLEQVFREILQRIEDAPFSAFLP